MSSRQEQEGGHLVEGAGAETENRISPSSRTTMFSGNARMPKQACKPNLYARTFSVKKHVILGYYPTSNQEVLEHLKIDLVC